METDPRCAASCACVRACVCSISHSSCSYVADVAAAFDVILHKGVIGEVYNIGTSKERSVLQVAHDVCRHFNLDASSMLELTDDRPFNDRRHALSSS